MCWSASDICRVADSACACLLLHVCHYASVLMLVYISTKCMSILLQVLHLAYLLLHVCCCMSIVIASRISTIACMLLHVYSYYILYTYYCMSVIACL